MVGTRLPSINSIRELALRQIVPANEIVADDRVNVIDPSWFQLDNSRGLETPALKAFMRFSVIISDYALYFPALLAYAQYATPPARKIDKVLPMSAGLIYRQRH